MRYVCTRLKGLPRLAAADVFLLMSFAGTVNVWRGVWNVLGLWLLPGEPELSCWITHLGCFAFLVLLNCSNSVLVRGVDIDASEEGGKCAVFPCHYLRLFFKVGYSPWSIQSHLISPVATILSFIHRSKERRRKQGNRVLAWPRRICQRSPNALKKKRTESLRSRVSNQFGDLTKCRNKSVFVCRRYQEAI